MRGLSATNPQAKRNRNEKRQQQQQEQEQEEEEICALTFSGVTWGKMCKKKRRGSKRGGKDEKKISLFYLSGVELQAGRGRGQDLGGVGDGSTHIYFL